MGVNILQLHFSSGKNGIRPNSGKAEIYFTRRVARWVCCKSGERAPPHSLLCTSYPRRNPNLKSLYDSVLHIKSSNIPFRLLACAFPLNEIPRFGTSKKIWLRRAFSPTILASPCSSGWFSSFGSCAILAGDQRTSLPGLPPFPSLETSIRFAAVNSDNGLY